MAAPRRKAPLSRTQALAGLVERTLLPDLRARAAEPAVADALRERWEYERAHRTTAATLDEWTTLTLTQVAVAWVLSAVFVRVLEDRGLTEHRRIAGGDATDSELLFLEMFPGLGAREYVWTAFAEVARAPVARDLLGPRGNPAWRLGPSHEAVRAMLDLFRESDADGTLRWRFDDADTRILGDLYQDLSAEVRERYALLQTPDFVERFILDRTLEPAIATFGIDAVRVIDPTCGSGHFLLGAFHRLLAHLERARPGADRRELAAEALSKVYGSDVNPYAVAIARFRLLLAFVEVCGVGALADAPALPSLASNVVVADSLLLGAEGSREMMELAWTGEDQAKWGPRAFDFADPVAVNKVFRQRFHAVVGNPPYIVCRDSALRELYREGYPDSASGKFALAAPFTERFFKLAEDGGYVGLINANSFMKREFGKGLVEKVLPRLDLNEVVDTSGAFIPGHGTPTVILFGRHRRPVGDKVRVIMGRRGEPETPADPANGKVWSSIAANDGNVGFENDFITVAEVSGTTLAKHPWSLGGGGASELKEKIEDAYRKKLADVADSVGITAFTLEDDAYLNESGILQRMGAEAKYIRTMVIGEAIRDWALGPSPDAIFPYETDLSPCKEPGCTALTTLWPYRTTVSNNLLFGGTTKIQGGLKWFEYGRLTASKLATPLTITFAEVATHNHFLLDRGGRVFKQTAPVIKLPKGSTEDEHLALLAWLNSSVFCFLMKQVAQNKGAGGARGQSGSPRLRKEDWDEFFQFSSTAISSLPAIDDPSATRLATRIEALAQELAKAMPSCLLAGYDARRDGPIKQFVHAGEATAALLFKQMVALQEELDWRWYEVLGLLEPDELAQHRAMVRRIKDYESTPLSLVPGHRPFEQVLHQSGESTTWFERNGYDRPTLSALNQYRENPLTLLYTRRSIIERNRSIALIERPEHKRRWTLRDYDAEAREAAAALLLDRVEAHVRSAESPMDVRTLVHALLSDATAQELASVCFPDAVDPMEQIPALIAGESVAYLAAMRHTDEGLRKRAQWERTWDLQRDEDAGKSIGEIPVPPKYDQKDYRESRYWSLRGKLDVPRERFIAYPGAETDPRAPLFGWAGWDHLQRARALATVYNERRQTDGWDRDRLRPLLAGLMELVPWLMQWHDAADPELDGQGQGRMWKEFVEGQRHEQRWTEEELRAWRPATGAAKRTAKRAKATG